MTTQEATSVSTWSIDPIHSHVEFSAKHMMVATVKGMFRELAGRLEIDEAHPERSGVYVEIDVASIDTGAADRDNHLRSNDFLNAEKYPKLVFASRNVVPEGGDRWKMTGDLTIRDVTREVVLDVTFEGRIQDAYGKDRAAFSAKTAINRHDFGVSWNGLIEAGGVIVGDTVKIAIDVAAVRQE